MKKYILFPFLFSSLFSCAQMGITASIYMMPASVPCDSCFTFSANVSGGIPPYGFQWTFAGPPSTIYTTQTFTHCLHQPLDSTHYLNFHVSDSGGMNTLDWPLFGPPIKFTSHSVCLVTVDSASGKNLIAWEQTTDPTVVSYNIYKETTTSGIYNVVGNVHRNNFSTYIDSSSNPAQVAARYKISIVDSCGNESFLSNPAKTIHLIVNAGLPNTWNLNWDNAEGFSVVKFKIWRSHASQPYVLIDSVQSSLNSYTDLNAPGGLINYVLEAISTTACNPSLKINSVINAYASSFSNFADNSAFLGVNDFNFSENIFVYPNPSGCGKFQISSSEVKIENVEVYNMYGEKIFSKIVNSQNETLELDKTDGFYIYKIFDSKKRTVTGKLIVQ